MRTSVIIPTYNYGRFLGEAIQSVRAQTVRDLEIIVIDDGSTDNTQEVLAGIADPRLRSFRTENGGIAAARNEGLRRARGSFIAFLDADDRWRPEKLERQLALMECEADIGAVFTDFVRFDEHHMFPMKQFAFFPELSAVPTAPTKAGIGRRVVANAFEMFVQFSEFPTWVQTLLFRSSVIEGLRFPERGPDRPGRYPITEDTYFCLRAYERAPVAFIDEALVEVRRHGHNVTQDLGVLPHARLAMLRLLDKDSHEPGARAALRRRLGRAWVDAGKDHVARGRVGEALAAFARGLRYRGFQHAALNGLLSLPVQSAANWFRNRQR